MDRMTKKIIATFTAMVCVAAVILVFYNMLTQGKITSARNNAKPSSEVEKLLAKDLETKYPETPTEVIKLYWRFNKCIYNNSMRDKKFEGMVKQLRRLYDDELLGINENSWDNMIKNFKSDKTDFSKDRKQISTYAVQKNSTVVFGKVKKRECATVISGTLVKEKSDRKQTYEKFVCRKDAGGNWKILGWQKTNDAGEIATLGDN